MSSSNLKLNTDNDDESVKTKLGIWAENRLYKTQHNRVSKLLKLPFHIIQVAELILYFIIIF